MVAGIGKPDTPTTHASGAGEVRERTIVIGPNVIVIENIGSIQILEGRRSWLLFIVGLLLLIAGVYMGSTGSSYGSLSGTALAAAAIGIVLILINLSQKIERGLSIGTCDGRATLIVSTDEVFLQRLLDRLTRKINTRDPTNVFNFNSVTNIIEKGAIDTGGGGFALGDGATAAGSGGHAVRAEDGPAVAGDSNIVSGTNSTIQTAAPPPAPAPEPAPAAAPTPAPRPDPIDDTDSALFGEPEPGPPRSVFDRRALSTPPAGARAPEPAPPPPLVMAERRRTHDPLLDGGEPEPANDDDWLSRPRQSARSAPPEPEGGGFARVLLGLLILLLLGGGVFAAWYFTGQTGPATSISLIATPTEPAEASPAPEIRGSTEPELPAEGAETPVADPSAAPVDPELVPVLDPARPIEVEDFLPPEPMVARASGLRYRGQPSAADNSPILSETRAGGEALRIDGRTVQADGEWYRVTLVDGRAAWFKASLAVPRTRLADSLRATTTPNAAFAATSPRILEPAEGVQLGGGPQPVLLAWSGLDQASAYVVEIQSYDAVAQRWIEDPLFKRVTVSDGAELSEEFPSAGYWRWRVRAASASGEQTQFSRWSAFGIRN